MVYRTVRDGESSTLYSLSIKGDTLILIGYGDTSERSKVTYKRVKSSLVE
jgi:hypothetical protein